MNSLLLSPLSSRQYSGYLPSNVAKTHFLHYWLVESENDSASDPLVLWLNGGPGCSSLEGYFIEHGPYHFESGTESEPKLYHNPNTWCRIANVLYLESPIGVGYSYSTKGKDDYVSDDEKTATENFQFLMNFFAAYPEYANRSFYITGESYAGIYVPTLVELIRQSNENKSSNINLKGFMIGNGCIGWEAGSCGPNSVNLTIHINFIHNHALVSDLVYDEAVTNCGPHFQRSTTSRACAESISALFASTGTTNIYDIYAPCIVRPASSPSTWRVPTNGPWHLTFCTDTPALPNYLNDAAVREAIHVKSESEIGVWKECSTDLVYRPTVMSLLPLYPTLIRTYRTLIYSGDVDGCVPYIGTQEWTSALGFPVAQPWRPWTVDDRVAGYVTAYAQNDFKFVTVKNSGHMVPQYKPVRAFALFEKFIRNEAF